MYDFIIVGAGSAGCVLACRLVSSGAKVLLLEAGGSDDSELIRTPGTYGALQDTAFDWGYRTVPQPALNGRRIFCPRGRVLGGSSSINYMMYVRGNRLDYDGWAGLGNPGWSYDDVLAYFVRSEANARYRDAYHGAEGPLPVGDPPAYSRLTGIFMAAAAEAGLAYNPDPNGAAQDGSCHYQATIGPDGRASTAAAFLRPVMQAPNLTTRTNALVTRVLFDGTKATGVEYIAAQGLHTDHAGEVILCGGALNSPHLLMLSGIGNADELSQAGVRPRHDLPGVGRNLQDHLNVNVRYQISEPLTLFGMTAEDAGAAMREFRDHRSGPFSWNFLEAGGFYSVDPTAPHPDTQFFFVPSFGTDFNDGSAPDRHGFLLGSYANRPASRGTVKLASAYPLDKVVIDPDYLSAKPDLALAIGSIRRSREIGRQQHFAAIGAAEIYPGPQAQSDAELEVYVRSRASTTWHLSGTCKMGTDALAVVDPQLRVHGIDRLRVVDASIMPRLTSCNTNAPTIMIAEKAADMILGRPAPPAANIGHPAR